MHSGFTLLELMLVITVAAVILGLGIPSMTQFIRNNQLTSAANDMLAAIHIARAEAVKRRTPTQMCFTSDPDAEAPTCDGDGTQGWVVWVDDADPTVTHANDGNGIVDADELVVLRHAGLPDVLQLVSKPAGNAGYVAFFNTGFVRPANDDLAGVVICDDRGNQALYGADHSTARGLLISAMGRPSVTRVVNEIQTNANLLGGGSCTSVVEED